MVLDHILISSLLLLSWALPPWPQLSHHPSGERKRRSGGRQQRGTGSERSREASCRLGSVIGGPPTPMAGEEEVRWRGRREAGVEDALAGGGWRRRTVARRRRMDERGGEQPSPLSLCLSRRPPSARRIWKGRGIGGGEQ